MSVEPSDAVQLPDHNLGLDLMRVTEAAALAAGRWVGRGDKEAGDQAAVDAMRDVLAAIAMRGVVVIGEGEKDEAPMLFNGEHVGDGTGPDVDVAVDPVEGTTLLAKGMPNAISVIAVADRGSMLDLSAAYYLEKLVTGAAAAGVVDITAGAAENVRAVAKALGVHPSDVTVAVQDRPRHDAVVAEIRDTGARISFFGDGDVAAAISAATPGSGIDLLVGVGGAPEGVITACALKALGGDIQARIAPRSSVERERAEAAGHVIGRVLRTDDLVRSENTFVVATGITDGPTLRGVRYHAGGAETHSLVLRSRSGTVREVHSRHALAKVRARLAGVGR